MKAHQRAGELIATLVLFALGTVATCARAWDHPGYMTSAAIA